MNNTKIPTLPFPRCLECGVDVDVRVLEFTLGNYTFFYYCPLCNATFNWDDEIPIPFLIQPEGGD